jgi:hypothetical protein
MITVVLSEEIDAPESMLDHIRRRLVQSVGEAETAEEIIRPLLQHQRLLVVSDALSERTRATQRALAQVHAHAPVNAMVVTTRRPLDFGTVAVNALRPERLGVKEVVYFLTEYIKRTGAHEVFSPRDTLLLGERLLAAVERGGGELRVTPLFIKLFVENALRAAADGRVLDEVPASIPETIVAYLKGLNPSGPQIADPIPDARLLEVARCLAWLCLEGDYVPRDVRKETAEELKAHPAYPDGMNGFLVALENCVLTYAEQFNVPDMVFPRVAPSNAPTPVDA